jgi:hypothetical protein
MVFIMDDERKTELVSIAVNNYQTLIEEPVNDFQRRYATRRLIEESFNLEVMRVSYRDIMRSFIGIITDIKIEKGDIGGDSQSIKVDASLENDGLLGVYESKVSKIFGNVMKSDLIEFEIYFPWNLNFVDNKPDLGEHDIHLTQITDDDWGAVVKKFRDSSSQETTESIVEKVSNGNPTFWKAEIDARGPDFAHKQVVNAIKLCCAKLNFSIYSFDMNYKSERYGSRDHPFSQSTVWTDIQQPFAYLLKDHNGAHAALLAANETRSAVSVSNIHRDWESTYSDIPVFDSDTSGTEKTLENCLLMYQNGLTTPGHVDSFFNFWRTLENLTVGENEKKRNVIKRADFCKDSISPRRSDFLIDELKEDLYHIRNQWVHNTDYRDIHSYHEKTCKFFVDVVIQFYIDYLLGMDNEQAREILKLGTDSDEKLDRIRKSMSVLDSIDP